MKKKFIILAIVFALFAGFGAYAYHSGFCQVCGCNCHQYYGGDGGWDRCTECGHYKVDHS